VSGPPSRPMGSHSRWEKTTAKVFPLFSARRALERKKKTNRVHENERKSVPGDCDSADWLNRALKTRKDNAA